MDKFASFRSDDDLPELDLTSDLSQRVLVAESNLRVKFHDVSLTTLETMPVPSLPDNPELATTSQPNLFVYKKVAFPARLSKGKLPFQEYSHLCQPDLDALARSSASRSVDTAPSVTFSGRSFRGLEESSTDIIKGVSLVTSTFQAMVDCLGEPTKTSDGRPEFDFTTDMDRESLVVLLRGTLEGLGALGTAAVHHRVQLAAMYRDKVLEGSGFDSEARSQLRSLPLCRDSLFRPEWSTYHLNKLRAGNQDAVFNTVAENAAAIAKNTGARKRMASQGGGGPSKKARTYTNPGKQDPQRSGGQPNTGAKGKAAASSARRKRNKTKKAGKSTPSTSKQTFP